MLCLDVRDDCGGAAPPGEALRAAVTAALAAAGRSDSDSEISLCIVDLAAMRELNRRYRASDRPTNVLSFPAELPPDLPLHHLGDIVICAPLVDDEARAQGKPPEAHWAHLLVHGTLHLLGYDHIDETDAEHMETLESRALATLGWPCPYTETADAAP